MNLKINDTIKVLSGDDKGRTGKITKVLPQTGKVLVDGLNTYRKHIKNQEGKNTGGVVTLSRPIAVSKVQLVCTECKKPTRFTFSGVGKDKVRVCNKCKKPISTQDTKSKSKK